MNFWEVECLTGDKSFDFGADVDHNTGPEFLNEF